MTKSNTFPGIKSTKHSKILNSLNFYYRIHNLKYWTLSRNEFLVVMNVVTPGVEGQRLSKVERMAQIPEQLQCARIESRPGQVATGEHKSHSTNYAKASVCLSMYNLEVFELLIQLFPVKLCFDMFTFP